MPTKEHVARLIAMVREGRTVEAMQAFYADDATMQENHAAPRAGLATLLAHERKMLDAVQSLHVHPVEHCLVDDDEVVIHWVFDIVDRKGRAFRLDELTLQTWRDGKIVRERFFYDPAPQPLAAMPPT